MSIDFKENNLALYNVESKVNIAQEDVTTITENSNINIFFTFIVGVFYLQRFSLSKCTN